MDTLSEIDRLIARLEGSSGAAHQAALESIIEAVVASYRESLFRLACSILQDADDAEDAVQQTLLAAALSLESYQPGSSFKAWLFTIAVNACRGALRKRKTRRALAELLGRAQRQPENRLALEEAIVQDEASRQVWQAVSRLDEKHRLVVHLRYQQNLAIAEIAQILSIPEKTVYSRLYDSFSRLRKLLTEADPGWKDQPAREEGMP